MSTATRLISALAFAALPLAAAAQGYPAKPIRMIVPLAAASAVDNAARIVTQKMSASMGQQIVIENVPGAAGLIGTAQVAKAAPDGYTLGGFNDSIMTMLPNMHANLSWDILRDFEPVSLVATIEWGLVANNAAPFRNAADLLGGSLEAGVQGPCRHHQSQLDAGHRLAGRNREDARRLRGQCRSRLQGAGRAQAQSRRSRRQSGRARNLVPAGPD